MSWRATGRALNIIKSRRGVNKKIPEPIKHWKIKKGDTVQVLAGKDKGKSGKVAVLDHNFNRLYIQGLNTHSVYVETEGFSGMMQREAPLHYSNVALVDPQDGKPCRVKYQYTEDGEKVRVSRSSGRIIPYPVKERDFNRVAFPDGVMDTKADFASRVTFVPSMLTFEEEMLQKFGSHISSPPPPSNDTEAEATVT